MIRMSLVVILSLVGALGFSEPLTFTAMTDATWRLQAGPAGILNVKLPVPTRVSRTSTGPATRSEMVDELHQMFLNFRPSLRGRPTTVPFRNYAIERCNLPPPAKESAFELLDWGFVAPVGPLMTGSTDSLTPEEYGDCLGLFLCRLADLTHPWSAAFSPDNMPN